MNQAQGLLVDDEGRCVHYHGEKDIVSLQCYECKKYYACYRCHNAIETHVFSPYPLALSEDRPILCGACKRTMTFQEYQNRWLVRTAVLHLIQVANYIIHFILNRQK